MLDWNVTGAVLLTFRGKWVLPVVAALEHGPMRYHELLKTINDGLRPKVLAETLQSMERRGLVSREGDRTGFPPMSRYELTSFALALLELLQRIDGWVQDQPEHIVTAIRGQMDRSA